jgi:hypothetical protein
MPGFGTGLAHALAVGVEGYGTGDLENQQRLLALAAQRRAQALEADKANTSRIDALAKAAEAGLTVSPSPGERSGEETADNGGSSTSPEAGPAVNNAKPTRLGSINGMDISVPPGLESKAVRDARAMKAAGMGPKQTLHERVMELRNGGMPMDQAIKQARGEFGEDPDPQATHRANRKFDVANPTRRSSSDGATPESRAKYVLRRASDLQKARKVGYRVQPGMDRATAEQTAGDEWDRVHGIETQVTTPSAKTAPAPKPAATGDINLAAGDTLSTADRQMAAKDPKFRAWLISKGKLKGP